MTIDSTAEQNAEIAPTGFVLVEPCPTKSRAIPWSLVDSVIYPSAEAAAVAALDHGTTWDVEFETYVPTASVMPVGTRPVPVEAASWIVQALMDPAARGDEVTNRSAAAIFRMVRYYDATGIGWGGERSQADQIEAT